MSVPALGSEASAHTDAPTLPYPSRRRSVPASTLAAVLDAEVSPGAVRMWLAVLVVVPPFEWVALDVIAEAARLSHHAARPFIGELVKAGLVQRQRKVIRGRDRYVYALRVAA